MPSPFGRRTATLLAAALAVGATVLAVAVPAAAQQSRRGVDGTNVGYVRVNDGGTFEQSGPGRWTQFDPRGRPYAQLDEVRRDAFSVRLTDRSRHVDVVLDLRNREVGGTEPGSNRYRRFYAITDVEARRGRDWRDDDRGPRGWGRDDGPRDVRDRDSRDGPRGGYGRSRDVEVGPVWNQGDAERKCRAKAAETRGEWTGQWHTTVQGRMSVCEIRYR